jgi:FkbM family methyltransferase
MSIRNRLLASMRPLVDRFPRLASVYRNVRDEAEFSGEPRVTPWGFKMTGNSAMAAGTFEPVETQLVRTLLEETDVLVNVGANVGYYCCHALSMGKSVIAFEPINKNLRHLCKNILANGWTGAEIYPLALSNRVGVLEIYGSGTGASVIKGWASIPESHVSLVPCSTMDRVLRTRLQGRRVLVLADVEGAEKAMLEGASEMLAADPKPVWLMEICFTENHPGRVNEDFHDIFNLFWAHGYQALSVEGGMRLVTPADIQRWHETKSRDFGYVSYLFRPTPSPSSSLAGRQSP